MMMKSILILSTVLTFISMQSNAQDMKGKLDQKTIDELHERFQQSPENVALTNAVSHNDIKKLAVNRENDGKINHYFSNRVKVKGITNQKKSGRCWLYTGLNTLRPLVQEKYALNEFEFSQTYNFFYFLTLAYSTYVRVTFLMITHLRTWLSTILLFNMS